MSYKLLYAHPTKDPEAYLYAGGVEVTVVRTYTEALNQLSFEEYDMLYVSFDIGTEAGETGVDLLKELYDMVYFGAIPPVVTCIASGNIEGDLSMHNLSRDIYKLHKEVC